MDKKSSYTKQDLLDIGAGKVFGTKNGKLPIPPMLMIDRISNISETGGKYGVGFIEAEMDINPEHWFFKCHFKNCLLYTSPSPRDRQKSRMPSSA